MGKHSIPQPKAGLTNTIHTRTIEITNPTSRTTTKVAICHVHQGHQAKPIIPQQGRAPEGLIFRQHNEPEWIAWWRITTFSNPDQPPNTKNKLQYEELADGAKT